MDIAPTVASLLNISGSFTSEGKPLPIRESYSLRVAGAPAGLALWRGEEWLANVTASGEYCFRGLSRGVYTLKAGEIAWQVLVNGDAALDLAGKATPLGGGMKEIIGIILILAINLAGIVVIFRIWKRGD